MSTLIYTPSITIRVRASSLKNSIIDVTDDIQRASIVRNLGPSLSTINFTLLNTGRKYDDVFESMDAIVVYLRRLKTMLSFTGYLDATPKFAAVPGSVNLSASCTLKRIQYFYWDPGTQAAQDLALSADGLENTSDGGLAVRTRDLLTQVAGWSPEQIHIGAIPSNWFARISKLADALANEQQAAQMAIDVGSQAYIRGTNSMEQNTGPHTGGTQNDASIPTSSATIPGIGPGTGALPNVIGKCSSFGGPGGGAYGHFALTGESGVHPNDHFYCAMRWPYVNGNAVPGAKAWWRNRKILVVNPSNQKAVVLRAADWGPADWTGRVIDLSPWAISALGASTDDTVHIGFAKQNAALGLIKAPVSGGGLVGSAGNFDTGVQTTNGGWGNAGNIYNEEGIMLAGHLVEVNKKAVASFKGFVADLVKTFGYHPQSIGGFANRGNTSNPKVKSAHAYGAAIDIDPTKNPRYTGTPGPYALPHDTAALVRLCRKWNIGWGGEWIHTKDYMHFEIIGAPGTAPNYTGGHPVSLSSQDTGGNWTTPVKPPYTVTAHFGDQGAHWAHGHSGTDFACPEGTPIRPVGPGVVHDIGFDSADYGNFISVDHGKGVYTFYAHMKSPSSLVTGDRVDSMSSTLGHVDSTGNVTGSHVHLELRLDADTYSAALASGGPDKYVIGNSPPPRGVPGAGLTSADALSVGSTTNATVAEQSNVDPLANIGGGLFNVWQWISSDFNVDSALLSESRALMNDVPIMGAVGDYMTAGMRDFCSAPNGDFIGWFPDYYGFYGQAGKIVISPLEIDADSPPTIFHDDAALKTHQYVVGAMTGLSNDATDVIQMMQTAGIVSIEDPAVLEALLNVSTKEAQAISTTYLNRYGARPELKTINTISGPKSEFYFACMEFIRNWSEQYQTTINVAFMPEAFPGMLACFPFYGIQGYIRRVTHDIDLEGSGGFRTQISAAPWSTIGSKGPKGLPKGGPL